MRYLSPEWIERADRAVAGAAKGAPEGRVVIDQHVTGAASYRVTIDRGDCSVVLLDGEADGGADASFTQSADTARAVATGETDAHQAFLLGKITFQGNADLLIERRDAFTWFAETLAPVMADTVFTDR